MILICMKTRNRLVPPRNLVFHHQPLSHADRKFEEFPDFARGGIVVASVDDALHDLAYMAGYRNNRFDRDIADDGLPPKGPCESCHPHEIEKLTGTKVER